MAGKLTRWQTFSKLKLEFGLIIFVFLFFKIAFSLTQASNLKVFLRVLTLNYLLPACLF